MGISVTGDIILILKHAKEVGGRMATDKALEVGTAKTSEVVAAVKKSSNVSRSVSVDKLKAGPVKMSGPPVSI